MAKFKSIITHEGAAALTASISANKEFNLTRAICGSGRAEAPGMVSKLVTPEPVLTSLSEKKYIDGDKPRMQITVQVTNAGLEQPVCVREIGVYGASGSGDELLVCYAYLIGSDSDNVIPPTAFGEEADTIHLHELAIAITSEEASSISVDISPNAYVTMSQLKDYASPLHHTQTAKTIMESTGYSTEEVQRRQDNDIQSIIEQLNTGFVGTTVTHTFIPEQMQYWKGYNGSGVPEGVLDTSLNRLYK